MADDARAQTLDEGHGHGWTPGADRIRSGTWTGHGTTVDVGDFGPGRQTDAPPIAPHDSELYTGAGEVTPPAMGPGDETQIGADGVLESMVAMEVGKQLDDLLLRVQRETQLEEAERVVEESAGAIPVEPYVFDTSALNNTIHAEVHGRTVRVTLTNPEGFTCVAYLSPASVAYLEARLVEFAHKRGF